MKLSRLKLITTSVLLGALVLFSGCNSGSRSKKPTTTASAPSSGSGSTSPGSTAPAPGPEVKSATLDDKDGSLTVSTGDELTVTFKDEVIAPLNGDPAAEFDLAVQGDTFGGGAKFAKPANKTDVVIVLGDSPKLRVSGSFSASATTTGAASGLDVSASTTITGAAGGPATQGTPVDLDGPFKETFVNAAQMTWPRGLHTSTLLDDGRILVTGGVSDGKKNSFVKNAEIFDPAANTFTDGGRAKGSDGVDVCRILHTATKLNDGRVLVVGGYGIERKKRHWIFWKKEVREDLKSAHIFNPNSNKWSRVGNMATGRSSHQATRLDNGNILITGGYNGTLYQSGWWIFKSKKAGTISHAEVFNPSTKKFVPLGGKVKRNMIDDRFAHSQTPVNGGKSVMLTGGAKVYKGGKPQLLRTTEVYLGGSVFAPRAAMAKARWFHSATALASGHDVLVTGGYNKNTLKACEVYRAKQDKFEAAGNLKTARARHATSLLLNGDVLVVGGVAAYSGNSSIEATDAEVFELANQKFTASARLTVPRNSCTATTLPDGRVVVIGGFVGGSNVTSTDGIVVGTTEIFSRN